MSADMDVHARCLREDPDHAGPDAHGYWEQIQDHVSAAVDSLGDDDEERLDRTCDAGRELATLIMAQATPADRYECLVAVLWSLLLHTTDKPIVFRTPRGPSHPLYGMTDEEIAAWGAGSTPTPPTDSP